MITSANIHKAVKTLWANASLDPHFSDMWSTTDRGEFTPLNDTEAGPSQPFPYCIFEIDKGKVDQRMSGQNKSHKQEIHELPVMFRVQTRDMGTAESAKEIAARLVGKILEVFGGHPTIANQVDGYELDHGNILMSQYQTEYAVRTSIENWSWTIEYKFVTDTPVAV